MAKTKKIFDNDTSITYALVLYESGLTFRDIGLEFGISGTAVRYHFHKMGVKIRTYTEARRINKYNESVLMECLARYNSGTTIQELERTTGLTGYSLSRIFKERGWFMDRKEWNSKFHSGLNSNSTQRKLSRLRASGAIGLSLDRFGNIARYITKLVYSRYISHIGERPVGYHIDHKYVLRPTHAT